MQKGATSELVARSSRLVASLVAESFDGIEIRGS